MFGLIDRVLDFVTGAEAPATSSFDEKLELSVAALMVEAARMDDTFDPAERAVIERMLAAKFDLGAEEAHQLVVRAEAAVKNSTQYFPFTHRVVESMSAEERVQVIEMLWKVAYADGVLDPHEDMLVRRIAGLIYVPDRDRGLARRRALEKLAAAGISVPKG
ncbi:TerB family tellurite resistance protein [Desertibaculum subflavum]|uniref:tellurite resistance TerB family protein n=1 Tax=Desertibaculum subflavum TaxID=2268458 RepID=UPI000E6766EF